MSALGMEGDRRRKRANLLLSVLHSMVKSLLPPTGRYTQKDLKL